MDRDRIETLIDQLASPASEEEAAQISAELLAAEEQVMQVLQPVLKQADPGTRMSILRVLGRIGGELSLDLVKGCLADDIAQVRAAAVYSLGIINRAGTQDSIVELTQDTDPGVRMNAAWSLGQLGGDDALSVLEKLVQDEVEEVRVRALEALEAIASPDSIKILIGLLKDEDAAVRSGARDALVAIGRPALQPVIDYLGEIDINSTQSTEETLVKLLASLIMAEDSD